ncbi:MAG: inorganic phosphate transporter [Saprospiraceae bacterium]
MDSTHIIIVVTIILVVVFDFTNGFHDASNMIASAIASRAISPVRSVIIVAVFSFLGPLLGGTAVANTIGKFIDISDLETIKSLAVILSGLIGVIFWNLATWFFGMPSSSSHALMGGLAGAVIASAGADHVLWGFHEFITKGELKGVTKVLLALILSPVIGLLMGFIIQKIISFLLRSAKQKINKPIKWSQYFTVAWLAFSHGANDAQKSMGILTLVLVLGGIIPTFQVPLWVMLACSIGMTIGVLLGGWKIVKTLGFAIYKIRPIHALNSQLTSAFVIFTASLIGAPVSTTHVVAASIMGVGSADHLRRVKWKKAKSIIYTWLFTIPGSAIVAVIIYSLFNLFLPFIK